MGQRVKIELSFVVDIEKGFLSHDAAKMADGAVSAAGVEAGIIEPGAKFRVIYNPRPSKK